MTTKYSGKQSGFFQNEFDCASCLYMLSDSSYTLLIIQKNILVGILSILLQSKHYRGLFRCSQPQEELPQNFGAGARAVS